MAWNLAPTSQPDSRSKTRGTVFNNYGSVGNQADVQNIYSDMNFHTSNVSNIAQYPGSQSSGHNLRHDSNRGTNTRDDNRQQSGFENPHPSQYHDNRNSSFSGPSRSGSFPEPRANNSSPTPVFTPPSTTNTSRQNTFENSVNLGCSAPPDRSGFNVAMICALTTESDAVEAAFDTFFDDDRYDPVDSNQYQFGRMGRHNVVLAYLPSMGRGASASVAANIRSNFPNVRLGLVVGICGGVPRRPSNPASDPTTTVFLGDVIVSEHLVQFDFGRQYTDGMVRKDTPSDNLGRASPEIRSFLTQMKGWRAQANLRRHLDRFVAEICSQQGCEEWVYLGRAKDELFSADYRHKHQAGISTPCLTCSMATNDDSPVCQLALESPCRATGCDKREATTRMQREGLNARSRTRTLEHMASGAHGDTGEGSAVPSTTDPAKPPSPVIHFGLVASGDVVMKSSSHRDRIAERENAIAFEMEGAGVWENMPTIVVKGVCDYADSHKNKNWQRYAAVTAAACAKALLTQWR